MVDRVRVPVLLAAFGGTVLLIDVLRVWLPSLTTIFGSAGTTPDWAFVLFALAWVLPAGLLVPLAARRWLPTVTAAVAVLARLVLQAGVTGDGQLYASCVAALAVFGWLVSVAGRGWHQASVAIGFAAGLAATTALQLSTGTVDLLWIPGPIPWLVLLAVAAALLIGTVLAPATGGGAALWFGLGPATLLAAQVTTSIGRTWATPDWPPPWWGAALVGVGSAAGVVAAVINAAPRALVVVTLLASTALAEAVSPLWIALLAVALPAAVRLAAGARERSTNVRAVSAYLGTTTLFLLCAVYNTAFDSFSFVWLPAITLLAAAALALCTRGIDPQWTLLKPGLVAGTAVALSCTTIAGATAPEPPGAQAIHLPLRLVTYNIRSGISAYGRFDVDRIAEVIEAERPDVVQLQEVDRGMLVTGAQDSLRALQTRLHMHAYFGPSSDQLFGEAILSRQPLEQVSFRRLSGDVSPPTGVLSGVLRLPGGTELTLVVTHLQTADGVISADQVRQLAAELAEQKARSFVLTGDFNAEPGDPALAPVEALLRDGLAAARPLPTWPAEEPKQQLDQVFLSPGLSASAVHVAATTASDHLPVAVTISGPAGE
ncbi:hypothetical protein GCM10010174_86720 [Kutzneria viridogrisea]|uniref:Endonuclease/exonuclease/phosphatase family metal-dependent hydrolase n=1 Tax=Kutzneria viridogrisea TaxID=47990 RepID=A0ABR6BS33_9PSEU|nr:endonuclease/exonuclease/phosphatase family metal-dependent hydrolase [Kutzneria viridogrisea]